MSGLENLIGQSELTGVIRRKVELARTTGAALPHLLLCGDSGQGKMVLAASMAEDLGVKFLSSSADRFINVADLNGLLSNIGSNQVLAISDIETLRSPILNVLVDAVSTFRIDIVVGAGANAKKYSLPTLTFTFVGTTSKPWLLDERLRRWCTPCQFAPYSTAEAAQIAIRIGQKRGVPIHQTAAAELAAQCHRRPGDIDVFIQRIANHRAFLPGQPITVEVLHAINEFFGSGSVYPDLLAVADGIRGMGGMEFENWTADLFRRAGFQVDLTQASGDHGIDLMASRDRSLIAVQCKRWDGSIGEPVLRDLFGAMTAVNARRGCLITTGTFTAQAQQFSRGKPLTLIGFETLMEAAKSPTMLLNLLDLAD